MKALQILVEAGYTPDEYEVGSEDSWAGPGSLGAGIGEGTGVQAMMYISPDGQRCLTEGQALAEVLSVSGQEDPKIDRNAELERASLAFGEAKDAIMENPEVGATKALIEADWQEINRLEWYPGQADSIATVQVGGVQCWRTVSASFDGDLVFYWCADPEAAGLEPVKRDGISDTDTLALFWG